MIASTRFSENSDRRNLPLMVLTARWSASTWIDSGLLRTGVFDDQAVACSI